MYLPVILHYSSVFCLLIDLGCVWVHFSITAAPSVRLSLSHYIKQKGEVFLNGKLCCQCLEMKNCCELSEEIIFKDLKLTDFEENKEHWSQVKKLWHL